MYFRDVSVGEILGHELLGQHVKLRVFLRAPYDRLISDDTRFFDASGARVVNDGGGLRLELTSLSALATGAISFWTPPQASSATPRERAEAGRVYHLFESRDEAEADAYARSRDARHLVSYFDGSVGGLRPGAPVTLLGERLGVVTDVSLVPDPEANHDGRLAARVAYVIDAPAPDAPRKSSPTDLSDRPVRHQGTIPGLDAGRIGAVLEASDPLTGMKLISLEYAEGPAGDARYEGDALVLPGRTADFQQALRSLGSLSDRLSRIPFERIGKNLDRSMASLSHALSGPELRRSIVLLQSTLEETHALVSEVRTGVKPTLQRLPAIAEHLDQAVEGARDAIGQSGYGSDSTVQRNLQRMLDETANAARSLRLLADFLNRHPEALLNGRSTEAP